MRKVLIVDDDPGIANLLGRLVQKRGHQPLIAFDGIQALELAKTQQPDLIFTDIMMPDFSGSDLINCLKADPTLAQIPLIVLSGTATTLDIDDIAADEILNKPFQLKTVYEVLDRYLKNKTSSRSTQTLQPSVTENRSNEFVN